jgi:hypothetical protein
MSAAPISNPPLQIGSSLVPLYVERQMKVYAVTEGEVASLSMLNSLSTAFYSSGSFTLSAAVGIWTNAIFYTDVPPAALVAKWYVAPFILLATAVLFFLGWRASKNRRSTWDAIRLESSGGQSR